MGCGQSSDKEKFLKMIKSIKELKEIEINNIQLTKQAYFDLLHQLASNQVIESFSMKNVDIQGDSDKLVLLANTIKKKTLIQEIELVGLSQLGSTKGKSLLVIALELKELRSLKIVDVQLENEDVRYINQIWYIVNNLTYLEFSGVYFDKQYLEEFLGGLKSMTTVRILKLEKLGLTPDNSNTMFKSLAQLTDLRELSLCNNSLKNYVAFIGSVLDNNQDLSKLMLNNCSIGDKDFSILDDILQKNDTLVTLELNSNSIGHDSVGTVRNLLEGNHTLKTIYLLRNKVRMSHLEEIIDSKNKHRVVMEY